MDMQFLSGILLIVGFVLVMIASVTDPPGIYGKIDSAARLQIIANHQTRWLAANIVWALAGPVTAVGLLLFSIHLQGSQSAWLLNLAAATAVSGAVALVVYLYVRTSDPAAYFESSSPSPWIIAWFWLTSAALILYGVVFLQGGYPNWLGYGIIAIVGLLGVAALVFRAKFFAAIPPQIYYLLTFIAGIVIL